MANAYIAPILDAIVTIAKANLNTKIDSISNDTLYNIDATAYAKSMRWPERFPWFNCFPFGDATIDSEYETGGTFLARWPIITEISYVADDMDELQVMGDIFLTAMIRSLTSGSTGNIYTFNQTAENIFLTRCGWTPINDESGNISGAAYAFWEAEQIYDPTNE